MVSTARRTNLVDKLGMYVRSLVESCLEYSNTVEYYMGKCGGVTAPDYRAAGKEKSVASSHLRTYLRALGNISRYT